MLQRLAVSPRAPLRRLFSTQASAARTSPLSPLAAGSFQEGRHDAKASTKVNLVVADMNDALDKWPMTTALWYLYSNLVFAGATFGVLSLASVPAPVELAAAWGLNRLTTRLRMPFILASAAALAKANPSLGQLQLSKLMMTPFKGLKELADEGGSNAAKKAVKGIEWIISPASGLLDKYGLAYLICGRVIASASMIGFAAAIHYGLDAPSLISEANQWLQREVVGEWISPHVSPEAKELMPQWALEGMGLDESKSATAEGGKKQEAGEGGGLLAAGAGVLSRWAMSCLCVNAVYYPWLLRFGIARFSRDYLGPFLQKNVASKLG